MDELLNSYLLAEKVENSKITMIYQHQCLGDLIFLQKLFRTIAKERTVILPILKAHSHLFVKYLKPYDNMRVYDIEKDFPFRNAFAETMNIIMKDYSLIRKLKITNYRNFEFLPLGLSWMINIRDQMVEKYRMAKIDHFNWQDSVNLRMDEEKSNELYYNVLGLKDNSKYCFVNKNFGDQCANISTLDNKLIAELKYPNRVYKGINPKTKLKIIEMRYIDGFTMMDWYKVFQNANEIHTVETSICYIIDIIGTKSKDNFLYTRWYPESYGFGIIDKIFTRTNWNYVYDGKEPENEIQKV